METEEEAERRIQELIRNLDPNVNNPKHISPNPEKPNIQNYLQNQQNQQNQHNIINNKIRSIFDIQETSKNFDSANLVNNNAHKSKVINYNSHVYFKPINENAKDLFIYNRNKKINLNEKIISPPNNRNNIKKDYERDEEFINNLLRRKEQSELVEKQQRQIFKLKRDLINKDNEMKQYRRKESRELNKTN